MATYGEKKAKIQQILDSNEFEDIIEKKISDPKGIVYVPKKYAKCSAIIIITTPQKNEHIIGD